MSRRKRRPSASGRPGTEPGVTPGKASSGQPRPSRRLLIDVGILAVVFAATVGIAELAGAANLGVAIGVGQVTFSLVLVALLLRG